MTYHVAVREIAADEIVFSASDDFDKIVGYLCAFLKFSNYTVYKEIAHALNAKKKERDAYIAAFIGPVEEKLKALGLRFHIKGRTKSIHSIYNKMQKQ